MSVSSSTSNVIVAYENKIATITLNRAEVLNALDLVTLEELAAKLQEVKNSDALVVILKGSGRGFSSGGDIKSMLTLDNQDALPAIMDTIGEVVTTLYTMPKIVISSIHGAAAGLGLSIGLASDYVFAQQDAVIAMNFIGIGLIPDGAGHFFMEKRVGEDKAKQLIWEGKRLNGEEAAQIGLVDEVVEDVHGYTAKFANGLLHKPLLAMIETKKIYSTLGVEKLEKILALEKQGQAKMRVSGDHKEGITAFLQKRLPKFEGK
ncbi:MAG: enoyl-CoA hydratase [Bacillaceae bacterium]